MNPTLLQQPPFDFPLASDQNYLGTERTYSNLGGYPSNDPFPFLPRRTLNGGTNSKPSSSLAGPTNSGAELTPQPPLTGAAYHSTAHPWLSPLDPTSGSIATGGNVASSFTNATLPKPFISNASSEQFSAISGATPPTSWRDSVTTDPDRPRLSVLPRALSPHQSYTAPSMNCYHSRPIMDRLLGNYASTPFNTPFIHRTQPFRQSHSDIFSSIDNAYPAMPQTDSQRQEGPPFKETQIIHQPLNTKGNSLRPEIVANIQKGFFQVDGKWTCYRRNYFSVNCSFTLNPNLPEGQLYLKKDHDSHPEPIQHFAMLISAKTSAVNNLDCEDRALVQHTPKRSKDTESTPGRQIVVPSNPPQHSLHSNGLLQFDAAKYHGTQAHSSFGYPNYPDPQPAPAPSSHTFDRIQFAKATANNGKRRAQQQYFHVVVQLLACINGNHGEEWVLVASQDSDQVVVRGRSPGHYKDNNRRDSQSNMDPDRLSGPGSDESSGAHHFGSGYQSSMNWHSNHSGQLHHGQHSYHGRTYHHCLPTDGSPPSTSSSTTHTDSSHNLVFHHSDTDTLRSVDICSLEHSRFTPPSPEAAEESFFSIGGALLSRKRPLEEDSAEDERSFGSGYPFSGSASPHTFNFLPMAPSKILCAS